MKNIKFIVIRWIYYSDMMREQNIQKKNINCSTKIKIHKLTNKFYSSINLSTNPLNIPLESTTSKKKATTDNRMM